MMKRNYRFSIELWQQTYGPVTLQASDRHELATMQPEGARRSKDCGDSSCMFATSKSGMRTNGGCRCYEHELWLLRKYVPKPPQQIRVMLHNGDEDLWELVRLLKAEEGSTK